MFAEVLRLAAPLGSVVFATLQLLCPGMMACVTTMTDTFASTGAVTIPVLALAGIVIARALIRGLGEIIETRRDYEALVPSAVPVNVVITLIAVALWAVLMFYSVTSEDYCLNYMLTHDQSAGNADANTVKLTIQWLMIATILVPLVGVLLPLLTYKAVGGETQFARRARRAERGTGWSTPTAQHGTRDDPSNYLG
jgi:hypothetical protein